MVPPFLVLWTNLNRGSLLEGLGVLRDILLDVLLGVFEVLLGFDASGVLRSTPDSSSDTSDNPDTSNTPDRVGAKPSSLSLVPSSLSW